MRASLERWDEKRLRLWLAAFFVALAIPTAVLVRQAYSQLKWEAFQRHRVMAEELVARIDRRLIELINAEEARSFADYAFLIAAGDPAAGFLQRSPLSAYPVASAIPGLLGYFQVNAQGVFSTPLLPQPGVQPAAYGVSQSELDKRLALGHRIREILSENRLVYTAGKDVGGAEPSLTYAAPPTKQAQMADEATAVGRDSGVRGALKTQSERELAPDSQPDPLSEPEPNRELAQSQVAAQTAFDRLNETRAQAETESKFPRALGRVEDLKLDSRYRAKSRDDAPAAAAPGDAALLDKRLKRTERGALPEQQLATAETSSALAAPAESRLRVSIFESEIDAFAFSLLDSGHFVLFRKVWRDGQRYIQGALLEPEAFLRGAVESAFRATALSQSSDLAVAYRGNVLAAVSGQSAREYLSSTEELQGALLHQARLSAPLSDLQLVFSINRLPAGPGGTVITWAAAILALVLCGGFYLMYRVGLKQVHLTRQQQDFVSAVSHELKTPLTSIRMYGEILREGWADDEKKKTYYAYIHDESERLSRLISNVLQLARMTRNDLKVDLKPVTVSRLMDGVRSKIASQIERAEFTLNMECDDDTGGQVLPIDADYFTQIVINLVDNAIKFSAKADNKAIDIQCRRLRGGVQFSVRDYGSGVAADQMKRIFTLFYRSENELTRETVGTGIGLALVHQLARTMNGKVDVVNRDPGAEFRVSFPAAFLATDNEG
ncbi:MAG: HAMP domain-containing histidine kinase [Gammaproteobacteria bacterium]|nr:HAMP domain-containing histidine kinase [Gammaproteobacteria bacterium]